MLLKGVAEKKIIPQVKTYKVAFLFCVCTFSLYIELVASKPAFKGGGSAQQQCIMRGLWLLSLIAFFFVIPNKAASN
jgi:hypothetical protein